MKAFVGLSALILLAGCAKKSSSVSNDPDAVSGAGSVMSGPVLQVSGEVYENFQQNLQDTKTALKERQIHVDESLSGVEKTQLATPENTVAHSKAVGPGTLTVIEDGYVVDSPAVVPQFVWNRILAISKFKDSYITPAGREKTKTVAKCDDMQVNSFSTGDEENNFSKQADGVITVKSTGAVELDVEKCVIDRGSFYLDADIEAIDARIGSLNAMLILVGDDNFILSSEESGAVKYETDEVMSFVKFGVNILRAEVAKLQEVREALTTTNNKIDLASFDIRLQP